jgi:hypothetical protein
MMDKAATDLQQLMQFSTHHVADIKYAASGRLCMNANINGYKREAMSQLALGSNTATYDRTSENYMPLTAVG